MGERLIPAVLKTVVPERVPGVRIPLPPPFFTIKCYKRRLIETSYVRIIFIIRDLFLQPEAFIRSEAWRVVVRIPEPMSKFAVEKIITNAMKFDARVVGTNTLVEAWRTVEQIEAGFGATKWYRFLLLVEQLAEMRPESRPTILLPLRSIGTLMNVHFTQLAKWRRKAMEMGILSKTSRYVRRRLADEFAVKTGFSPLADGPALYKVKRGRKPKKSVAPDQAV